MENFSPLLIGSGNEHNVLGHIPLKAGRGFLLRSCADGWHLYAGSD